MELLDIHQHSSNKKQEYYQIQICLRTLMN